MPDDSENKAPVVTPTDDPPAPAVDPWTSDSEGETGNVAQFNLTIAPNPDNEPVIAVKTAEGQILNVPASKQEEYADQGFELLTTREDFGTNGTKTVGADPIDIAFSDAERKRAEANLKRR